MISSKTFVQKYLNPQQMQWLVVTFCLCIFTGFVCSRALVSIGMIGLLVASLLFYGPKDILKAYYQKKSHLVVALYFIVVLLSGLYSEDKTSWWNWVRIKLPYLVLPLAFAPLARLDNRKFRLLLYGFIAALLISAIVVLIRYYTHYSEWNEKLSTGGALPMPYSHIRYALMLAFAFFCTVYLIEGTEQQSESKLKWPLVVVGLFIFLALHVFSVRSGLLGLYMGILYLAAREVIRRKKYLLGLAVVVMLAVLPFAANKYVPTFHNKMEYMHYDLEQYQKGIINEYSDAMRLLSMEVGIKEWKTSPLIGIGAGDIKIESDKIYAADYPQISEQNRRLPHNQFIWMLATTGLIGLACFLLAYFYPWLSNGKYKHWIFTLLHLMLLSSFFTEHTFEEQMGTGFYLIFLLLFLNRYQAND